MPEEAHGSATAAAGFHSAKGPGFPDVAPTAHPRRYPFAKKPDAGPGAYAARDSDSFFANALGFSAVAHEGNGERLGPAQVIWEST